MAAVTVRGLPDATHRALKQRAARHGRSTAAEIRAILDAAVSPARLVESELAAFGRSHGGLDLEPARDRTPAGATAFA